ncbi:MAG: TonB-dependent receptor, partial [Candidatus Latescibacteria bacterium]|nr:TonB-dependent receptor [Candidatus Latescibacterota bacterium]
MEIVHGPNSVMYGSDALGGVINVVTVKPDMGNRDGLRKEIGFTSQVSTADRTRTGNLSLDLSSRLWGARISGGVKSYGDVTRGESGGRELMARLRNDSRTTRILNRTQRPNAYESYDISARFRVQLYDLQQLNLVYQGSRQSNVPRYDVVETLSDSSRHFDPQTRNLAFVRYINARATRLYSNVSASISWHRQFERRIRLRFGNPDASVDQFGTNSYGVQLHLNKVLRSGHHLVYGGDLYYDDVGSLSYGQSLSSGDRVSTTPLFPDGSTFVTNGYFARDEWEVAPSMRITPGLRWSLSRLNAPFESGPLNPFGFGPITQSSSALTGSIGVVVDISDRGRWVANLGQGFRTPNLDDVSKLGPGKGGTIFEVPNSGLSPEKSVSVDSGLKIDTGIWQANVIGFYNRIHDLLLRRPALLNGSPTALDGGDTLQVFRKENAGKAFTAGLAADLKVRVSGPITLRANMGYTYGEDTTGQEPLTAMPPLNGLAGIDWVASRFRVSGNVRYSAEQKRLSAEDQFDLRIPEGGSPAWYTLNLRGTVTLSKYAQIQWALTNVLDQNYREHSSGLNAPGRNFILGVSLLRN